MPAALLDSIGERLEEVLCRRVEATHVLKRATGQDRNSSGATVPTAHGRASAGGRVELHDFRSAGLGRFVHDEQRVGIAVGGARNDVAQASSREAVGQMQNERLSVDKACEVIERLREGLVGQLLEPAQGHGPAAVSRRAPRLSGQLFRDDHRHFSHARLPKPAEGMAEQGSVCHRMQRGGRSLARPSVERPADGTLGR